MSPTEIVRPGSMFMAPQLEGTLETCFSTINPPPLLKGRSRQFWNDQAIIRENSL
jgi:hypothetical protein